MKKYKIMILVVLMSTLIAGVAFSQDGPGIKVSLLTNVNYQFDLSNFGQLVDDFTNFATTSFDTVSQAQNAIEGSLGLLSGLNWGFGFQMLFGLSDAIALGFEVGVDLPIASIITLASISPTLPSGEQISNVVFPGLIFLPRVVLEIGGFDDLLSIDILAGLRFGLDTVNEITNAAIAGGGFLLRFAADLEARLNIQFSRHFALYAGVNYILPFEVVASDNFVGIADQSRPDYYGKIAPTVGLRVSF